ncbi:MAG: efflux transporter outer membrane subunit, partial [Muribaculaceae bacterium]|nr:efflux transporter outer membrane subunit [Muribaculaceae bacterium]
YKVVFAVVALVGLSSCGIYKKYETPTSTALTKAYAEARQMPVDSAAFGNLLWEDVFTDPMLVKLIDLALANNTNLRNAQLNVEIAQANLQGARLSYLPSLALAPNGAGASFAGSDLSWSYTLPAQLSWEIDIFGKLLNSKRGAQAAVYKSEAYAQAVRSQIISGVANTYYAIAAVRQQLNLSRNTAQLWSETVTTMKNLKQAGGVTEAAVVQATANYYSILASITDLEVSLDQLNNTMSLLVNTLPQEWEVTDVVNLQVPELIRAGVPMSELAARPDVLAAEQTLAAAFYTTASARAAFYPGLTITANGGFTNLLGSMVKNPGEWFYQLAGSLVAPIFSRGQNIARLKASKKQQEQALNTFEYTLMSAASEVSDALTVYEKSREKSAYLVEQVANLEKSVEYTQDLLMYSTGSTNYLEVLTAQQGLLGAQISQITTKLNEARAVINLYQALGGGR